MTSTMEKVKRMEATHRNTQALSDMSLLVGKLDSHKPNRGEFTSSGCRPCHHRGRTGPSGQECRFHDTECLTCDKRGHLAEVAAAREDQGELGSLLGGWIQTTTRNLIMIPQIMTQ